MDDDDEPSDMEMMEGAEEEDMCVDEPVAEAASCKTRKKEKGKPDEKGNAKRQKKAAEDDESDVQENVIQEIVDHCKNYMGLMFQNVKELLNEEKMDFDGAFKFDIYFSRPAVGLKMYDPVKGGKSLKEVAYFAFGSSADWNISIALALACANCLATYQNLPRKPM